MKMQHKIDVSENQKTKKKILKKPARNGGIDVTGIGVNRIHRVMEFSLKTMDSERRDRSLQN